MMKNLPFPSVPRFDQTPLSLLPESFYHHRQSVPSNETHVIRTLLDCTVSRPVKLKKVFMHAHAKEDPYFNETISVTLIQNGKTLFSYAGEHEITTCLIRQPYTRFQYAVTVQEVLVQAGELQVNIELKVKNNDPNLNWEFLMMLSHSAQSGTKKKCRRSKIPSEPLSKVSD